MTKSMSNAVLLRQRQGYVSFVWKSLRAFAVQCWMGRQLGVGRYACAVLSSMLATSVMAQTSHVAFPYYTGQQALAGLYQYHLQAKAVVFEAQAIALQNSVARWCQAPLDASSVRAQWRDTLLAWQALSSPAVGPVIERRAPLSLDFWPTRETLLHKAMSMAPTQLADLERIGTPAKGFAALDHLLPPQATSSTKQPPCPYASLLAQDIAAHARVLRQDFDRTAQTDWAADEAITQAAFEQWVNQWLGGLERLRWQHMEQPVQRTRTTGQVKSHSFARLAYADNLDDWQAQWQGLQAQARLKPEQYQLPPAPHQALIPIEALLLGRGHIDLAKRWAQAMRQADAAMTRLTASSPNRSQIHLNAKLQAQTSSRRVGADVLAATQALKQVANLYQTEVAAALDVSLGFSDADGD